MTPFERYQAGEHETVYEELLTAPDAKAADRVARALIKSVRQNLELLALRWRDAGFVWSAAPIGQPGAGRAGVRRIEQTWGPLPATLRALFHELGYVDFVANPPDAGRVRWPEAEALDAIAFFPIERAKELGEELDPDARLLVLFLDNLLKVGVSGCGPIYFDAADGPCFDPLLHFENDTLRDPTTGEPLRLVPYLRLALLARGGIGVAGAPQSELDPGLLCALTEGLAAF